VPLSEEAGVIERRQMLAPAAAPSFQPPPTQPLLSRTSVPSPQPPHRPPAQAKAEFCSPRSIWNQARPIMEQTHALKIKGAELLLSRWG